MVVRVRVALVPIIVRVNIPLVEEMQERLEVPEPLVTLLGLRVQARPDGGETEVLNTTVPVNPFTGPIVMVEVPVPPTSMATLVGLALMVKS